MKFIHQSLILFLVSLFAIPTLAQDNFLDALQCEVDINYPPLSMTKEKLKAANTLEDLNSVYKNEWVKEYVAVEVLTTYKGKPKKAVGKSNILSQEQKELMYIADDGADISIKVRYIPDNSLVHNDEQEYPFSFKVDPEVEAKFPGGQTQLKQYLKPVIEKIPSGILKQYQLAVVTFTVDEKGSVVDPHLFWSSEDDKTDKLLLDAICNMPSWQPAEFVSGKKAKQDFALRVGDMQSCVSNMLNFRQFPRE